MILWIIHIIVYDEFSNKKKAILYNKSQLCGAGDATQTKNYSTVGR